MLLTPAELAEIAADWEANMPERWITLPQTQTRGLAGAEDEITYPEPDEPGLAQFPCRIQPGSAPSELPAAMGTTAVAWWTVQLPVRSRINPADRGYVTGTDASGAAWSRTLEVAGAVGPRTWEAVREVLCWEILPVEVTLEE